MVVRSYELLKLDRDGHVATITLNRPEKLNALSPDLTAEFHAALDEIDAEEDIRAVVLTGAGRGFCSGADVNRQLESLEGRQSQSPAPEGPGITALAPHIPPHQPARYRRGKRRGSGGRAGYCPGQ